MLVGLQYHSGTSNTHYNISLQRYIKFSCTLTSGVISTHRKWRVITDMAFNIVVGVLFLKGIVNVVKLEVAEFCFSYISFRKTSQGLNTKLNIN